MWVVLLTTAHTVIAPETLYIGMVDTTQVRLSEVLRSAAESYSQHLESNECNLLVTPSASASVCRSLFVPCVRLGATPFQPVTLAKEQADGHQQLEELLSVKLLHLIG